MASLDTVALKAARKRKDLSQQRVADILEIEQPTVQQWESGKSEPRTLAMLITLCDVLGLSADVLLGRPPLPSARFIADIIREAGAVGPDELAEIIHKRLSEMMGAG